MSSSSITKKESPYNPFFERVLLPAFRVSIVAVILAVVGLSSWLETNESIEDCSLKGSLSFHQIHLYRNITSNLTTPDSVSFGLWKSCYLYALNCSCTPTNLKYQPDIPALLQVATTHNATPPASTSNSSLGKAVPLLLALALCFIVFVTGVWVNRQHHYQYHTRGPPKRWTTYLTILATILLLLSTIFIAYVFGSTYTSYFNQIKDTCQNPNNNIFCARHTVGIEVILFGIALGLLFIAFILWLLFTVSTSFRKARDTVKTYNTAEYEQDDDDIPYGCCWRFQRKEYKENTDKQHGSMSADRSMLKHQTYYTQFYKNDDSNYSSSTRSYYEEQQKLQQPQDELAVWRDVTLYDMQEKKTKQGISNENALKQTTHHYNRMDGNPISSLPPPPPPITPAIPLIDTMKSSKSRVTSRDYRERKTSRDSYNTPSALTPQLNQGKYSRNNYRRESDDSAFTFGQYTTTIKESQAQKQQQQKYHRIRDTSRNNGIAGYKNNHFDHNLIPSPTSSGTSGSNGTASNNSKHRSHSNHTPTTMSPHPFHYPVSYSPTTTTNNRTSFCMTPFQHEDSYSSGSNASPGGAARESTGSLNYFNQQPHQVPILNMPPAGNSNSEIMEHPLNKKLIKDKRIQEYLQK